MKCLSQYTDYCFNVISVPFVEIGVGLFLYGAYTVLYILCIYILATRKRNRYCIHIILITAIYIAATIEVGLKLAIYTTEAQLDTLSYSIHWPLGNKLSRQFWKDYYGAYETTSELQLWLQIITGAA
ncbi:hypothetical protein PQX77_016077, partial [Marasmius sp. AFHP31]